MNGGNSPTTFIAGADGFVGRALVKVLRGRGHRVFGLARSAEAAERLHAAGAIPVMGDLLESGPWQDEIAADWVFHVPPYPERARHGIPGQIKPACLTRITTDALLLDTLAASTTRRIVYVADANWYGPTGPRPITEDAPLPPSAYGRCPTHTLDRLDGYLIAGLPIVTALPGLVYGNGSWFRERVIEPIMAGRRVLQFGKSAGWVSPIHVEDCARALVHLAEHGRPGRRYFLVNNDPIRTHEFASVFARLTNCPLRVRRLPRAAARFMVDPVLAGYLLADATFSNIRLREIGFRFEYPTLEQGLQQILGILHEEALSIGNGTWTRRKLRPSCPPSSGRGLSIGALADGE